MKKTFSEEPIPQCEHFKINGVRCGSPALNQYKLCFFHQRMTHIQQFRRERPNFRPDLPLLEDANAIQVAVQEVISAVNEDRLDPRRAGLMLYGLNTAACNLRQVDLEPRTLREQAGEIQSPVLELFLKQMEQAPLENKPSESEGIEGPPSALPG